MGVRLRVTVDLLRLRANLSAEEGREISCCEARQLLHDAGFVADGEGWIVREADLSHVRPEEVTSAVEVDADGEDAGDEPERVR
jgi:hypothetical protein